MGVDKYIASAVVAIAILGSLYVAELKVSTYEAEVATHSLEIKAAVVKANTKVEAVEQKVKAIVEEEVESVEINTSIGTHHISF